MITKISNFLEQDAKVLQIYSKLFQPVLHRGVCYRATHFDHVLILPGVLAPVTTAQALPPYDSFNKVELKIFRTKHFLKFESLNVLFYPTAMKTSVLVMISLMSNYACVRTLLCSSYSVKWKLCNEGKEKLNEEQNIRKVLNVLCYRVLSCSPFTLSYSLV